MLSKTTSREGKTTIIGSRNVAQKYTHKRNFPIPISNLIKTTMWDNYKPTESNNKKTVYGWRYSTAKRWNNLNPTKQTNRVGKHGRFKN